MQRYNNNPEFVRKIAFAVEFTFVLTVVISSAVKPSLNIRGTYPVYTKA